MSQLRPPFELGFRPFGERQRIAALPGRPTGMDRRAWETYFRANASRRAPRHDAVLRLPEPMHGALVASLQRFHLGEAGEGRVANEARYAEETRDDASLVASIELYVREEGRHARELALLLRALGAKTLAGHPSEVLFRLGRRALGFRNKMIAIACAEVVGIYFYRLLRHRVPDAGVADLGALVASDEEAHLRFQCELFDTWLESESAVVRTATLAWAAFVLCAASLTFVVSHGALLRVLGVARTDALRGIVAVAREAQGRGAAGCLRHRRSRSAHGAVGLAQGHGTTAGQAPFVSRG